MKYLLLFVLLLTAACSLVVTDTPQLRDAIETRSALDVLPVPDKPRSLPGVLRITIATFTPTPTASLLPTVTPIRHPGGSRP